MLTPTSLAKLVKTMGLPPAAAAVYAQIRLSKVAAGYKMVFGTPEQIHTYADSKGLARPDLTNTQGTTHGITVFADKTIYLASPSKETLIHELIHAATFEMILAVKLDIEKDPEILAAIDRLEVLKDQFLNLDGVAVDDTTGIAYRDAVATIREWQEDESQPQELRDASALAEFMAWGLANKRLAAVQASVPAKLVQLSKEALDGIKALFFSRARIPGQGGDMLSQLQFNTAIIIRAQAKLQQQTAGEVVLS